jgi:hypothetical protein
VVRFSPSVRTAVRCRWSSGASAIATTAQNLCPNRLRNRRPNLWPNLRSNIRPNLFLDVLHLDPTRPAELVFEGRELAIGGPEL